MKRTKFFFALIAVVAVAVVSFAYTSKKAIKVLTSKTFYYVDGAWFQRIEPDVYSGSIYLQSITSANKSSYLDVVNWQEDAINVTQYNGLDGSSYVLSFTIDNWDYDTDLNDEDGITLAQALDLIGWWFIDAGIYPSTSTIINVDQDSDGVGTHLTNFTRAENGRP